MRGSQRNAIHKNDSLSSLDCPLNPSLGVTLDSISKSEQNQLSTVDEPQRGKRREGRIKRKRKEGENLYSTWREGEVTRQERMVDLSHL